jgi:hypothetical protein
MCSCLRHRGDVLISSMSSIRLSELEALVAVLHLAVAVRAELKTLGVQGSSGAVESLVDGYRWDGGGWGWRNRVAGWGGGDGILERRHCGDLEIDRDCLVLLLI